MSEQTEQTEQTEGEREVKALVLARFATGYDEYGDGPIDDLIEYKNSLEDLIGRVTEAVEKYRARPTRDAWRLVTDLVDEDLVFSDTPEALSGEGQESEAPTGRLGSKMTDGPFPESA